MSPGRPDCRRFGRLLAGKTASCQPAKITAAASASMESTNHIRVAREYGPEDRSGERNLLGLTLAVRRDVQTRSTLRTNQAMRRR